MDHTERVTRDLRAEHLDPADFDVPGIVADLLTAAARPGDLDSASDQDWTFSLAVRRLV